MVAVQANGKATSNADLLAQIEALKAENQKAEGAEQRQALTESQ